MVCDQIDEAIKVSKEMLEDNKFGEAGKSILIEERITGVEASVFAVSDGENAILIGTAQDHKRAYDNDQGPNTGGMGAISPAPALDEILTETVMKNIVMPTINGMKSEGMEYEGILYAGIMLTDDGPKVIEFNCRFGDPETQVILPRLKTDLVDIVKKSVEKNLNNFKIELVSQKAITVVIASKGYPGSFKKELVLPSLDKVEKLNEVTIYHSGTSLNKDNDLISNGGRVFSISALGKDIKECREKAYNTVETINWDQGFYRKDIGKL